MICPCMLKTLGSQSSGVTAIGCVYNSKYCDTYTPYHGHLCDNARDSSLQVHHQCPMTDSNGPGMTQIEIDVTRCDTE